MVEYRRKPRINDKIRLGGGTPLQQSIFLLRELGNWTHPISVISKLKTFKYSGKTYRASNADVHKALEQLVNMGVLDKR